MILTRCGNVRVHRRLRVRCAACLRRRMRLLLLLQLMQQLATVADASGSAQQQDSFLRYSSFNGNVAIDIR